jgi:peptide/nickel transport system ATP-binding protein
VAGEILFHQEGAGQGELLDLAAMSPRSRQLRRIRGQDISMIFQEPMTSLSPIHTVGDQISEAIILHLSLTQEQARTRTIELLNRVGIPRPRENFDAYPFQLSGGMRQRVMIAMALSCNPALLIADEPTTAVDVTTQAQIMELLLELQQEYGMGIMLITHDLGIVAEMADDVVVMYLGQVAERGDVDSIFHDPKHPYTQALLRSIPRLDFEDAGRLDSIRGMVPDPFARPVGCLFSTRCQEAIPGRCEQTVPQRIFLSPAREVRCLLYEEPTR